MNKMNDAAWEQYVAIRDGYRRDPRWIALDALENLSEFELQMLYEIERGYQKSAEQYRLMP